MMMIFCTACRREIESHELRYAWQKVIGWERQRTAGGTNAISLREPQQEFMHDGCMRLKKAGREGQEALL